ncbi:MAG: hypothetical protein HZC47_11225 [Methanobacterium sp.]|uniref:hypothetical protein n=1 Tax=Methanobacterium sp. TaxID=2164 RepID=UPI003D64FC66|nr:hypothetical protein [Methanobacterium sp.]
MLLIVVIATSAYVLMFGFPFGFEGKESDFYLPTVKGNNISTYKNSCNELNMSQVSKDPFSLVGQKVKVAGTIQKKEETIQFNKTRTSIVLNVPELSPNPYILVTYSTTMPFKQGNIITVYGEYYYPAKDETMPEIANKELPAIKAAYIEKV